MELYLVSSFMREVGHNVLVAVCCDTLSYIRFVACFSAEKSAYYVTEGDPRETDGPARFSPPGQ